MSRERGERHLTVEELDDYLRLGAPAMFLVEGSPECYVVLDPPAGRIAIRLPTSPPRPDLTRYEHFELQDLSVEGTAWHELSVTSRGDEQEAYTILCRILDEMQLEGRTFNDAARDVLASFRGLLSARSRMSDEQQIGLAGELMLLRELTKGIGARDAVSSWRGPANEEHDFGFSQFDVEVKTTMSERRRHRIGTSTQLQPTLARPLYLLSIQLTVAGVGTGESLSDMVASLRDAARNQREALNLALATRGWRDEDHDLYGRRYTPRAAPLAFLVDDDFPAITPARLDGAVPRPDLIVNVAYQIDVSSLAPCAPPEPIATVIKEMGAHS